MKKFFAYKGNLDLNTAKIKKIDNTKFHLNSIDIDNYSDSFEVIDRCH